MKLYEAVISEFTARASTSHQYRIGVFSTLDRAKGAVEVLIPGVTWEHEFDEDGYVQPYHDCSSQFRIGNELHDADWVTIRVIELDEFSNELLPIVTA